MWRVRCRLRMPPRGGVAESVAGAVGRRGGDGVVGVRGQQVREWLTEWGDRLSIAAVNGPASVVVSGEVGALEELLEAVRTKVFVRAVSMWIMRRIRCRWRGSGLMEALAGIEPRSSSVGFFSTVTGGLLDTSGLDGQYWYRSIRQTVSLAGSAQRR